MRLAVSSVDASKRNFQHCCGCCIFPFLTNNLEKVSVAEANQFYIYFCTTVSYEHDVFLFFVRRRAAAHQS